MVSHNSYQTFFLKLSKLRIFKLTLLTLFNGSRYGSPRFLSGEPELELTTLSGELVLELTTPTGFTTKIVLRLVKYKKNYI